MSEVASPFRGWGKRTRCADADASPIPAFPLATRKGHISN
jgi:hypothetical protein